MKRKQFETIDLANTVSVQKLLKYLLPPFQENSESGVTIKVTQIGNRTGVPKSDATTWRYEFIGADWEMDVRAVWLGNDLLTPLRTHVRIESYGPSLEHGVQSANIWLRTLDL